MTVANSPSVTRDPVPVNGNYRINLVVYSDRLLTTVQDLTGKTVTVWIKDPDTAWYDYTATVDVAASGTCHITLTGADHTVTGTAELRVYVDGELNYPRYQFDFIEEAA